jgi:hypothetical protein
MFRLLLILSLLPIAAALIARWWLGLRVLAGEGRQICRHTEKSAAELGHELRLKALAQWRDEDPRSAAAREGTRRFGMAVPPLSVMVAVFALVVGKIPLAGVFAIVACACAVAAAFGLLTLPQELQAIARCANHMRRQKCFPNETDEVTVIRCAIAHAWDETVPPVLRWLHR